MQDATNMVVAGIDGSSAARTAAAWAAGAAQRRGETLRLVHAVVAPPAGGDPQPELIAPQGDRLHRQAELLLTRTADLLANEYPGLPIETVQHDGPPVRVLMDQSRSGAIATVVGANGEGRLAGAFFGSVAARLAAHGRGCIVIARPESAGTEARPGVVAVGVDGSVHSTDPSTRKQLSASLTKRQHCVVPPCWRFTAGTTNR
jgi:nucleotide-binding universal stress UspA family protein